jgi:hypothetical protein
MLLMLIQPLIAQIRARADQTREYYDDLNGKELAWWLILFHDSDINVL